MDIEYGGGRTVPRVAITNFNDEVLYYSDFCLRYEDWIETKLTIKDGDGDDPASELSIFPTDQKDMRDEDMKDIKNGAKGNENEGDESDESLSDEELRRELAEY